MSSTSTSIDGSGIAEAYLNYQLPPELRFRVWTPLSTELNHFLFSSLSHD